MGFGCSDQMVTDALLCVVDGFREAELDVLGLVDVWSRSGEWAEFGFLSAATFLSDRLGISHSDAKRRIGVANGLAAWPVLGAAVQVGELSVSQAELLLAVATDQRAGLFERDVVALVSQAAVLNFAQFRHALRFWASMADNEIASAQDNDNDDQGAFGGDRDVPSVPSRLHVAATLGDSVELSGSFDPVDGVTIRAAIDAALRLGEPAETDHETNETIGGGDGDDETGDGKRVPGDTRPESVRAAEALCVIATFFLQHHNKVTGAGNVPNLDIRIDLETLNGHGGLAQIGSRNIGLELRDAMAVCCHASVTRIVTTGESMIVDVGRATRAVSPKQEKVVRHRDQHCRFPGCAMPATFNDIHHVIWWSKGGRTDIDNLVLLCRRHHRMIHRDWQMTGNANGALTFTNPNGRHYKTKPPPTLRQRLKTG